MKKQERHLLSLYVCYTAVLTITVGQDMVYYKCRDFPVTDTSQFNFSCDAGKTIIVTSAVIGATDEFNPPQQCPITNNTCLKETTLVAELCTGRNSCVINQTYIFNDSPILCLLNNNRIGNFINITYTCIDTAKRNYGDICHFDEDVYNNGVVYIFSTYPDFPDAMGPYAIYQCSCLFTYKPLLTSANVTIRALLVKLTGVQTTCSERLSIFDSKGDDKLEFCSPCTSVNNVTTVPWASNTANTVMSFWRGPNISPLYGKFIIEITVSSESPSGSVGRMECGSIGSSLYSSTTVSTMRSSFISSTTTTTTTTNALLSSPSSFSSTHFQNTLSGTTLGSSRPIMATNTEQSTLFSSKSVTETRSSSTEIPIGGIVGIVLGSVGFIVIIITVLLCLLRKRKQYRDLSKENTNCNVHQSDTVMQNMRTTNNIDLHETTASELYTFQSTAHFSNELQTRGSESKSKTEDNSMSNYEEGAPVSVATYGPGMIQTDEQKRLRNEIADDLTTETQSMNSGDGDVTLVENQLYVENANTVTGAIVSNNFGVARPVSNGYDVARPVVQDGGKEKSAEVNGVYAVVQPMTNSVDHSYYNVPARVGNGTVHSPVEVSAVAEASSASNESTATNPMYKADSDVVLIDNTLYGSMLGF